LFAAHRELMLIAFTYKDFPTPFGKREKQINKPPTPLNPKTGIKPRGALTPLTHKTRESGKEKGTLTQLKMNKLLGRKTRYCAPRMSASPPFHHVRGNK